MINYDAIVLAAGVGKRMNAGENKQFIELGDKPLIVHTLQVFAHDTWCQAIILVVNKNDTERMEQLLRKYPVEKPIQIVEGGKERQNSVHKGLNCVQDPNGIVFIHDGARPFVSQSSLHELASGANQSEAALLAVPVTDTIKQRNGDKLTTLDRNTLWAAQTPQAFRVKVIKHAHEQALVDGFVGTDDASLVERLGQSVEIVKGSYDNMKLTTPEDLQRAQAFLRGKNEKENA